VITHRQNLPSPHDGHLWYRYGMVPQPPETKRAPNRNTHADHKAHCRPDLNGTSVKRHLSQP